MAIDELLAAFSQNESVDFEAKLASGGLPHSIWETYSAFANTQGGLLILGLEEREGGYNVVGAKDPEKQIRTFWDLINNREKVSQNILTDRDVTTRSLEGRIVITIVVPQATREQRPVFIKHNPLTGTFKRNHEGDYRCQEAEVRSMMRDASSQPFDNKVLDGFGVEDLDEETLRSYRQRFSTQNPDHPWSSKSDGQFLYQLGAFRKNRGTGVEGLTVAGLLMFGQERSIRNALPNYHVDFQERLSDDPEVRWTDRISLDGRWEANLYNYYFRVFKALTSSLRVPFSLDGGVRKGETHVHEALREALINQIVHADYSTEKGHGLITLKERSRFMFVNPGRLRVSISDFYRGGISDPRNPTLQDLFRHINLSERAGSGVPKILRAWEEQHYARPLASEDPVHETTHLVLPTVSTIPTETLVAIEERLGESQFREASELERMAMIMVESYGKVSNADLQRVCSEHPSDIGKALRLLVERGWLDSSGKGRWAEYSWPEGGVRDALDLFDRQSEDSAHLDQSSAHLASNSTRLQLSGKQMELLQEIVRPAIDSKKIPREVMEWILVRMCSIVPMSLAQMAHLVHRSPRTLSVHYLPKLIRDETIRYQNPGSPNDPRQKYVAGAVLADDGCS